VSARHGEPRLAAVASWLVLAASFGLSAATWIALARLAGFDGHAQLAGIHLALAWLMPLAVDGYVVVALVLWMAPVPARVARFARANTYSAAGVGVAAQSAYHCLAVLASTGQAWRAVLAAIVGAMPPAVAALAVHMRALIRRESRTDQPATMAVIAAPEPVSRETAELCAQVRADAKLARVRLLAPPAIALTHRWPVGRPPVHQVAAKSSGTTTEARPTPGQPPATDPASTTADPAPDTAAPVASDTTAEAATKPASKRPPTPAEAIARVTKMLARKPEITAAAVAARLDVPERTARRYLAAARTAVAQEQPPDQRTSAGTSPPAEVRPTVGES
jgi:hypothetical protein